MTRLPALQTTSRSQHRQTPPLLRPGVRPRLDELFVSLEGRRGGLTVEQGLGIAAWAADWQRRDPERTVVMGCDAEESREWRVLMLRDVRDCVERGGVPPDRIRYTGDTIDLSAVRPAEGAGAAGLWLRAVPSAQLAMGLRTIRSLLRPASTHRRKEVACTTAS